MAHSGVDTLLSVLDNVKSQGSGYIARCPFHDDNENSLSVNESSDGKVLYHCHAGCDQDMLTEGFKEMGGLLTNKQARVVGMHEVTQSKSVLNRPKMEPKSPLIWMEKAIYNYQAKDGIILYRVVRFEAIDGDGKTKKRFMQERPDMDRPGRWIKNLEGINRVLYNLPNLNEQTVFFVEGEKDADNLIELGLTATCVSGGANNWRRELSVEFKGKNVIIIPDNDGPGKKLAQKVYEDSSIIAKSVKILNLPGLNNKEDVSDWLRRGHDIDELMALVEDLDPEEAVASHIDWIHIRGKNPSGTIENMELLLAAHKIKARYNAMSKWVEVQIPGKDYQDLNHCYTYVESLAESFGMARGAVAQNINIIANKNKYHPVKDWILSRPWDGIDRIAPLAESLDSTNPVLTDILLMRWLIGAVAAVFEKKGAPQGGALILQGDQYIGKTAWFWSLLGDNTSFAHDSFSLDPKNKDSVSQFCSYWMVELGEFDSILRKASSPDLKAFMTRNEDEFRKPYDRVSSKYYRRTAMIGTINPTNFLKDTTGNRRYWVVQCGENFNPNHGLEPQQIWAQVYSQIYMLREGLFKDQRYAWHLTQDENKLLAHHNQDFDEISPIEDKLLTVYDFAVPHNEEYTASEIANHLGYTDANRSVCYHIGEQIRKITGQKKAERKGGGGRRVYKMPPPKTYGRN